MLEVELRANITAIEADVRNRLGELSSTPGETEIYHDTYFDTPDRVLAASDRELRIRTRTRQSDGSKRSLFTYKDAPFDQTSKSKREHELAIDNAQTMVRILESLGFNEDLVFEKHCDNFSIHHEGYVIEASVVRLPKILDTFIELEIQVPSVDVTRAAKSALFTLLPRLSIPNDALTTEYYADMVRRQRRRINTD